ncbi:MAG: putative MFS-type transporter [Pseudolabrys sp.]|jgi:MFS family permease|nr:putative MFS-type transporter [Pseudolabrys sp.]
MTSTTIRAGAEQPESAYAWLRLAAAVAIGTIGNVGMWAVPVTLPAIQTDFGVDRAQASLPYTAVMLGFAVGGVVAGRLVDRFGILLPLIGAAVALCVGYILSAAAPTLWAYALAQGVLVGGGAAVFFAPLMVDISHWFVRRRGIAVAVAACGNYVAGTLWPTPFQHLIEVYGWRMTHVIVGVFCLVTILPVTLLLRRPAPHVSAAVAPSVRGAAPDLGISLNALQVLLCIAGVACCVAMAMPQVHIVAYCGDLGYGVARGAEMLSLMLGFGIISRIASGFIADKIGGVGTLLIGSVLQGSALVMYFFFDSLFSLYVISALFGLFQGGIVPSYAIIVREYFPAKEAGTRVGLVIMATLFGMALGGWMSGEIFDLTGSYRAAFANGIAFNILNGIIALWLLLRPGRAGGRLAQA